MLKLYILLTKTTAAQNEDALTYHRVRGLYFQVVVLVAIIDVLCIKYNFKFNFIKVKTN